MEQGKREKGKGQKGGIEQVKSSLYIRAAVGVCSNRKISKILHISLI